MTDPNLLYCELGPNGLHVWHPAAWTTEEHGGRRITTTSVFRVYCQYCLLGAQPKT